MAEPTPAPAPKPWWQSKLTWVGIGLLTAATLEFLAKDELTPEWLDKLLMAAAGILVIIFRSVTVAPVANRVLAWLLAASLFFASTAQAADWTGTIKGLQPGTEYKLVLGADGAPIIVPLPVIVVGQPSPVPIPVPVPEPTNAMQVRAHSLTTAALGAGGSRNTAQSIALVYSVVADQVAADKLTPANVPAALKAASDVLIPASESAAWGPWRQGIGDAMTGKIGTKAAAVDTLRSISEGTKLAVNGAAFKAGAEAIDWAKLLEILLPIILQLIQKFLIPS